MRELQDACEELDNLTAQVRTPRTGPGHSSRMIGFSERTRVATAAGSRRSGIRQSL